MSASKSLKVTLQSTTALVGAALVAMHTSPAAAASLVVNMAAQPQQVLDGGDDLTVSGTGSITDTLAVDVSGVNLFIDNSGLISGTTTGVLLRSTADLTGGIDNSGTITGGTYGININTGSTLTGGLLNQLVTGVISGDTAIIVQGNSDLSGGINNDGTISGTGLLGAGVLVTGLSSDISGGIDNSGTIAGAVTGIGVKAGGDITLGVVNSGTISGNIGILVNTSSDIFGGITNQLGGGITGVTTAVHVDGGSDITGGINNLGSIAATTYGIVVENGSDITGGITNSGSISAGSSAIAIWAGSDILGGITNSGTISGTGLTGIGIDLSTSSTIVGGITNQALGTISGATAINVEGASDLSGGIDNAGTISGTAIGVSVDGLLSDISTVVTNQAGATISGGSYGIRVDNSATLSGGIDNTGTITGSGLTGIGISVVSGDLSGGILNNLGGTISGGSYGVFVDTGGDILGGIDNSGTIAGGLTGAGIYVQGTLLTSSDISGLIDNAGTISGGSYGIFVQTNADISGGVTNSGTISGGSYGVVAQGSSDISGGIVNQAGATIEGGNTAIAVWTGSDIFGGIDNSGTIGGTGSSIGIDVYSGSNISGGLTNQTGGVISGTGQGIYIQTGSDISGVIDNSGTISGGNAGVAVNAASNIGGGIDNSGSIYGDDTGIVFSTSTVSGGITNQAAGTISGGTTGVGILLQVSSDLAGVLDNAGVISGGSTGIVVQGSSNISGGVINTGTISGGNLAFTVVGGSDISAGIDNQAAGIISGNTAIFVSGAEISGGITNTGTIEGTGGIAINLIGLTGATPININGGSIIGDVADDTPTNGFSVVTVGGDFATGGNFNVSDLTVTVGNTLTVSAGDVITLDDMSASAGTFNFVVNSDVDFGSLVVNNGNVDLTGATVTVELGAIPNLTDGDEMLIADGNAAIAGGPGATPTAVVDSSFIWDFTIVDGTGSVTVGDNTELYLQAESLLLGMATTSNNEAVGEVLNTLGGSADPEIQDLLTALNAAVSAEEVNNILEGVQPTVDGGDVVAAMDVASDSMDLVDDQLASLRLDSGAGVAAGNIGSGLRAWGQVFGKTSEQDMRGGIDGYESSTGGVAMGMDTQNAAEDAVLGLAVSYAHTTVDSDNVNTTETSIDSYQFTVYGSHDVDDRTYVSGMAAYVFGNNQTERHNVLPGMTAHGDYDSDQFSARVEVGRDYQHNDTVLTPSLMANYAHYNADGYTETGAGGLNLTVDTESVNLFELGLGLDASWDLRQNEGSILRPNVHLGYSYDLIGDRVEATSSFVGGGAAFNTQGPEPARSRFDAGVGVKYFGTDNWEYTAAYNYQVKSDYDAHEGFLRAGYKF